MPAAPLSRRSGATRAVAAGTGSAATRGSAASPRTTRIPRSRRTSAARPPSRETVLRRLFDAPSPNAPVETSVAWTGSTRNSTAASAAASFADHLAAQDERSARFPVRASSASMWSSASAARPVPLTSPMCTVSGAEAPAI